MNLPRIILARHDRPDAQAVAMEEQLLALCQGRGVEVLVIPDVYHLTEDSPIWQQLAGQAPGTVFFSWLHPRPAQWLLQSHKIDASRLAILSLRSFPTGEAALKAIGFWEGEAPAEPPSPAQGTTPAGPRLAFPSPGVPGEGEIAAHAADAASVSAPQPGQAVQPIEATPPRWYPVIDGARCTNCRHCLQFCLFGVYSLDADGKVQVQNPQQCKPGCPACARICPKSAIMFPLYARDEAIAGAPGKLITPDPAVSRMLYARTGRTAPAEPSPGPQDGKSPVPFDDLDALVDQLDKVMQRRR